MYLKKNIINIQLSFTFIICYSYNGYRNKHSMTQISTYYEMAADRKMYGKLSLYVK